MLLLGGFRREMRIAFLLLLAVQDLRAGFWDELRDEIGLFGAKVGNTAHQLGAAVEGKARQVGPQIGDRARQVGPQIEIEARKLKSTVADVGSWVARVGDSLSDAVRPESTNDGVQSSFGHSSGEDQDPQENVIIVRIDAPQPGATSCSPIVEPSLDIHCDLEGEPVNCTEPMAKGTVAHMKCREAYVFAEYPGYNSVTCNDTYSWTDPIIRCVPDCGKRNPGAGQQLVAYGTEVNVGEFSWHIGVYRLNTSQLYGQICGATLITPSLVMSAAHCFWDTKGGKVLDKAPYKLAAGKYHRDWYVEDPETQKRDVAEFFVHKRFKGHKLNLAYDIAMVKTTEPFELTWAINVICVDWQLDLEDEHLSRGNNGAVAGWGITELNEPSSILKWVTLPFVPYIHCGNVVEPNFQKYLTQDKLCGGWLNRGISVCPGDSGGGYVFPQMTRRGQRYFLQGIASAGHSSRVTGVLCQSQQLAVFTQISTYRAWVEKIVFNKTKKFETGD